MGGGRGKELGGRRAFGRMIATYSDQMILIMESLLEHKKVEKDREGEKGGGGWGEKG